MARQLGVTVDRYSTAEAITAGGALLASLSTALEKTIDTLHNRRNGARVAGVTLGDLNRRGDRRLCNGRLSSAYGVHVSPTHATRQYLNALDWVTRLYTHILTCISTCIYTIYPYFT